MDTIFALASGSPPAAIAVIRISGAQAFAAAASLAGSLPPHRRARLRILRDPRNGELLDHGLVLVFPGPRSATGEDLVELHLHGGRAVVAAVEAALGAIPGLRPAEAGEFTRRALMTGRIDLAQAEGLGDLLTAETQGQRRRAMAAVGGSISAAVRSWSERTLAVSAAIEAVLDFSDEADVGEGPLGEIAAAIEALARDIRQTLSAPPVERLRDGIHIVLAGPTNAGKSTLFNAMVGREAAIVSAIAGTTRDRIEAPIVRDGIAYVVIDTAGLAMESHDAIERIGIERARDAIEEADILLWLGDAPPDRDAIWLLPQVDRPETSGDARRLSISAWTGFGMGDLWEAIADRARGLLPREDQLAFNQRQRGLAQEALIALEASSGEPDPLIIAEQLRLARRALDEVTGATGVENMLDALFSRFCIGK